VLLNEKKKHDKCGGLTLCLARQNQLMLARREVKPYQRLPLFP